MPWGGAGGKKLWLLSKVLYCSILYSNLFQSLGQTSVIPVILTFVSWGEGQSGLYFMVHWFCRGESQSDLYFTVQWFCWWMNVILGDNVWHKDFTHKIYVGQWPVFHSPVILLHILKTTYLMDECHNWDNGLVWYKDWPHRIYVDHWPIFHDPVIFPYTSWKNVMFGIIDQCDTRLTS